MSKEIDRRAFLRMGAGIAGGVGAAILATKISFNEIRNKMPGLDMVLTQYGVDKPLGEKREVGDRETAEKKMIMRRLAEMGFYMLGAEQENLTAEQYELGLRWLNAINECVIGRIQRGEYSEWSPNLYEGAIKEIEENRAEWDGGLTEIVRKQLEEEQEKLKREQNE